MLHTVDATRQNMKRVIVCSRNTDVLVLLTFHKTAEDIWINAGTKNKPKYIPIHDVRQALQPNVHRNQLTYHVLTGCDSTSQFSGHGKKST